ncbi:MAG: SUF system NifU family Fe-S cluster assembly protein [Negativicoccus succinicivorans]|uniref:Fe-S cluster assembly sulfur transfer protein SufU n=1 Tax=Negativicoccus succinicivorans TaxID=620903 RepID=UPI00290D0679|nr:SUF system NifU family Fe-S cluster assembly protein [Negativicoccus succinicivorans]MDU5395688.1 SUF system NifU family Fe-S cluster assembly protein [Negativicoccus succinicivorans]
MNLQQLYTDLILEHNQDPRNHRPLTDATVTEHGHNPNCGDDLTMNAIITDGIVEDIAYEGQGCAISQASASMLCDVVRGKSVKEAKACIERFIRLIQREELNEEERESLEEAIVLENVSQLPARVKCAVLAWHTLDEAMKKIEV